MTRIKIISLGLAVATLAGTAWGQRCNTPCLPTQGGFFFAESAQPIPLPPKRHSLLYASAAILIASSLADGITTQRALARNAYEVNPAGFQGAIALKATATPALLGAEWLLRNHPRAARWFAALNCGLSFEFGAAALHNSRQ